MVGGGVELPGLLCLSKLCTVRSGLLVDNSDDLTYRIEEYYSFDSNNITMSYAELKKRRRDNYGFHLEYRTRWSDNDM